MPLILAYERVRSRTILTHPALGDGALAPSVGTTTMHGLNLGSALPGPRARRGGWSCWTPCRRTRASARWRVETRGCAWWYDPASSPDPAPHPQAVYPAGRSARCRTCSAARQRLRAASETAIAAVLDQISPRAARRSFAHYGYRLPKRKLNTSARRSGEFPSPGKQAFSP